MKPSFSRRRMAFTSPSTFVRVCAGGLFFLLACLPLHLGATSVVPPSFEKLVNESDYVVRAVVQSITSEWREKAGQRRIYTIVKLDVREVIVGKPPIPLELQLLGGRMDGQELVVEGAPKFEVGQEDILFIRGNGRQFYPLTGIMHGRYPILKDPATGRPYMARANRVPLAATAEVSRPMAEHSLQESVPAAAVQRALSPESFIESVRATVNPNSPAARAK
jgi:hypothetical protein